MKYAIEKCEGSLHTRYIIRGIINEYTLTRPVDGRVYRTEDAARRAAQALGIEIEEVGNIYLLSDMARCPDCYRTLVG